MSPGHKVEGELINIVEGDIMNVIFQQGVGSAVEAITEPRGDITAGVQPTDIKYKTPVKNLLLLTDCEERGQTRRQRPG